MDFVARFEWSNSYWVVGVTSESVLIGLEISHVSYSHLVLSADFCLVQELKSTLTLTISFNI